MLKLEMPHMVFEQMLTQAKEKAPTEACGILAGKNGRVERIYKMTNVDNSREHYMMEPKEQFAVAKAIRSEGLKILAIYHSHPESPARPSEEDIRLAVAPDIIHVIISLQGVVPVAKGFHVENTNVTEVSINIVRK